MFRIGQKVVCIANRTGRINDLNLPGFVKGHVYTITSFYEEPPHGLFLRVAELGPRVRRASLWIPPHRRTQHQYFIRTRNSPQGDEAQEGLGLSIRSKATRICGNMRKSDMGRVHTEAERASSYLAFDNIKAKDTDARLLTIEQAEILSNWCGWQHCATFEDRNGSPFPLQAILDLYHASIVYETFESWYEDEPKPARKAYVAICRKHKIKHGAST